MNVTMVGKIFIDFHGNVLLRALYFMDIYINGVFVSGWIIIKRFFSPMVNASVALYQEKTSKWINKLF